MISEYLALCGAMSPLGQLVLASDLAIAFAYFSIPVAMLLVVRHRREDVPYPWLFMLFAAFILSCGLTHLVHAIQMPWTTFEHTIAEATVKAVCAAISMASAIALIVVMPAIFRAVSPAERRRVLEAEVASRIAENAKLVREINHRLGNQLQVLSSAMNLERRSAKTIPERDLIRRLQAVMRVVEREYRLRENVKVSSAADDQEHGSIHGAPARLF